MINTRRTDNETFVVARGHQLYQTIRMVPSVRKLDEALLQVFTARLAIDFRYRIVNQNEDKTSVSSSPCREF
uniref:Uncharacterized protein n=1 Tax=Timema bartmani TaxID=61472 RepID=A0A7R9EUI8_9NEOP|nr:unnamed protein product [Timema bartmani]